MNRTNHSAYEQETSPVEEEPRQHMKLETLGKAGLMWADIALPKEEVASLTGLTVGELRRFFGAKPSSKRL
ncbi:hypothetical protein [Salipiger sp.]|uniref:hypothetical protein n=1 Tax=Salipiger sp. TaxID=2078585 RepID=UPI003A97701A